MNAAHDRGEIFELVHKIIMEQDWLSNKNTRIRHIGLAFPSGYVGNPKYPQSLYGVPDDGSHVDELVTKAACDPLAFDAACTRASYELRSGRIASQQLIKFAADVFGWCGETSPGSSWES